MQTACWECPAQALQNARWLGRLGTETEPGVTLHWPCSGVQLRMRCTLLRVELEAAYTQYAPWVAVLVDGVPVARFALARGRQWVTALANMDGETVHTIAVVRDTQPILDDPAMCLRLLTVACDGEPLPQPEPAMTIEFIGDSLTSGEGTVGPHDAMEWTTPWLSGANSYAQMLCTMLNAQGRWVSQSGWGVYWGWDGDCTHNLPSIFDAVCGVSPLGQEAYAFDANPVDVVVVNLGTNDANALANAPLDARDARLTAIEEAATAFLAQIRARYPKAQILWAYGMCGAQLSPCLRRAIRRARKAGDDRVQFVRLPLVRQDEVGSRAHPGVANHLRVAQRLADVLRDAQETEAP